MVRIASFNVENLFSRPKAFRETDLTVAQPILQAYTDVNALFQKAAYSAADRTQMRDLLVTLDIYAVNSHGAGRRKDSTNPRWAWLRKNRGSFDRQPNDDTQDVVIEATGRADWIGWVELAKEATDVVGTRTTARVVADVNADIIGIVEAEDRPSLVRFNRDLLADRYAHAMLVDGNDERGIDVGILTRDGFDIASIRSNVDLEDATGVVFSRDCPQYEVQTPSGATLHVLVNHFKSQSGGGGAKRKRQAKAVRDIVVALVAQNKHVVVLGDLNEGPAAGQPHATNLASLYGGPVVECYTLGGFDLGTLPGQPAKPGTFDSCGLSNRLDYIFVSQSLQPHVTGGGVFRKGLWGNRQTRPTAWETYPEMTDSSEQASDHAAVFLDLNI